MTYRLHRRQVLGGGLAEVFAFFKNPHNLEAITPPWLGLRVLHTTDNEVREGTRIRYLLSLHGVTLRWESRIAEYTENASFADEQTLGPYSHWYHRHLFGVVPGGVVMEDIVDYRLPLGPLGRVAHAAVVRRRLAAIFDYRASAIWRVEPASGADRPGTSTRIPSVADLSRISTESRNRAGPCSAPRGAAISASGSRCCGPRPTPSGSWRCS